ncbi:hypothetical protein BD770DRAFT_7811 [Pilaira anomala]|nr:hypothetical protein BD770DRAFT_7811 [Pilaira anomala]
MSLQNKMPIDWDIDILDYWQTSLSSYKKHHAQEIETVTSDKVSKDILDTLPIKEEKEGGATTTTTRRGGV